MTKKKKILVFGAIAAAAGVLIVFNAAAQRDRGTSVRLDTVERKDLVATVTASGQIQPQRQVDVSADITGRITSLPVREGDWVDRGDLLIRIDPSQYEAAVARNRASLAAAEAAALQAQASRDQDRRRLDRLRSLRATDSVLVSDEELELAETNFEVSEALFTSSNHQVEQWRAALQEAMEQLAKTVLRAPMSGQVTRLAVEEGEVALASTFSRETGLLMTVSDLSVIQVNVRVDETDVVRLHVGDSTEVTIDAYPDTTFAGRVTKISQSAIRTTPGAGTGTEQAVDYDVEVTLDDPPTDIRPDLSATAKIVTATRDSALAIPIIALTVRAHTALTTEATPEAEAQDTSPKEEVEGVFVVREGTAEFRPVRVGIAGEEFFEVLDGLAEGDSIVAGPYQTIRDLRDGTAVRSQRGDAEEEGES